MHGVAFGDLEEGWVGLAEPKVGRLERMGAGSRIVGNLQQVLVKVGRVPHLIRYGEVEIIAFAAGLDGMRNARSTRLAAAHPAETPWVELYGVKICCDAKNISNI